MTYWGKLVGGVAGLATGRWYAGLLGLVLGHQFDRGMSGTGEQTARLDRRFLDLTFAVLGHIAKRDGPVQDAEIRAAQALMASLALTAAQRERAIEAYRRGKPADYPMFDKVTDHFEGFRGQQKSRTLFLKLQLAAALDAGELSRATRAALWELAQALDFTRVEMAQLEALIRTQNGFAQSREGQQQKDRLHQAYVILGVSESASNREIKKAYRRLMNQHHPDKLGGQDVAVDALQAAEQKTREINQAYKLLQRRRGFR